MLPGTGESENRQGAAIGERGNGGTAAPRPIDGDTTADAAGLRGELQDTQQSGVVALIERLGWVKEFDEQLDQLKAQIASIGLARAKTVDMVIDLYQALDITEPFQHEEYTVRTKQGRESVRIDDKECERLVGAISDEKAALFMEKRWHISDPKMFKIMWQGGKLESVEDIIKEYGILVIKPAEDKVIVERGK